MISSRYQRWLRFILGGLANTGFTYLFYLLLNFFLFYQFAYFLAYISGIVFSYYLNTKFVFRVQTSWRAFFSFPLVYVAQYGLSAIFLLGIVEYLDVSEVLAPLLVAGLLIPFTYLFSKVILTGRALDHDR